MHRRTKELPGLGLLWLAGFKQRECTVYVLCFEVGYVIALLLLKPFQRARPEFRAALSGSAADNLQPHR